jgi:hypothetical protein
MEEQYTDCILQGSDVLALHGLDDDDTTQSSMIKEDRSFLFDDDEEDSIYEDADDGAQLVALHAYQTAKGLWFRGKETFGVGTVLGLAESVCCTVASAVGFSDIERDLVKPNLQCVDEGLQPTYAAIANVWKSWSTPSEQQLEARANSQTPIFEIAIPESDEGNWIPLNLTKTNISGRKESFSRLDSLDQ